MITFGVVAEATAQAFVTIWNTSNPGTSNNNQILIPGTGTDYSIVWEEVNNPRSTGNAVGNGAGRRQYGTNAAAARNILTGSNGWSISGDSPSGTLCLPCPPDTVLYVKQNAAGANNGSSWTDAFTNLQDALTLAGQCTGATEIWVAEGTYKPTAYPTGCTECSTARDYTFHLENGVKLYGGFAGTEDLLTERNITANPTILSGDFNDDDVATGSGSTLSITGNTENAYHVVLSVSDGATTILDGFTVSGGNANGSSNITVEEKIITRSNGGGMHNFSASPTITNTTFTGNSASSGGGMCNFTSASPTITNTAFTGNSATSAGGMFNATSSSPTITNTTFAGNSVNTTGGGMMNFYSSSPTITNTTFSDNSASSICGGMYNFYSSPTITNSTFTGNSANLAGGMFNFHSSSPTITNTTFAGNSASNTGGIRNNSSSNPIIRNSILWGNGSEIGNFESTPVISYSIVQGGYSPCTDCPNGDGNTDPLFEDAPNGNLHLQFCSPAIDAGDDAANLTTVDLDGNARKFDAIAGGAQIDMGAFERQGYPPSCQNITAQLDVNSAVIVQAADINDNSSGGCGSLVFLINDETSLTFTCHNLGANIVTLTVSDGTSNTNICTAMVTVQDNTPPSVTCADITVSLDGGGNASIEPEDVFGGGTDACGMVSPQSVTPDDFNCQNLGNNIVTLTVNDGNGNTNTCTATVTVQDNTLPAITCPNPVTVTCASQVPAVNLATVTASDNCGAPAKSHVNDATTNQTCANRKTVTRTYRATDASGNSRTCSQVITVFDDVKPNFSSVPANVTVQCNSVPAVGNATATDGCGGTVTVSYNGQTVSNILCTDKYTLIRQWTAADLCGNTKIATQRITVTDTQKPTFTSVPANVTVQCSAVPTPGSTAATDNCDPTVDIAYNGETRTNGACADSYILTRQWTATDNCGNTRTATQRITVQDTQKPAFTAVPAGITLECTDPIPDPGAVAATDNCDASLTITYVGQSATYTNCPNTYTLTRTWKATDNCGNWATATQSILVQDTQAPAFTSVPAHITIECSDPVPPIGQATATDNCGGYIHVAFLGNSSAAGDCPWEYVLTRSWRATDECGYSVTATQTITVWDTQAPVFNNEPANITLACGAALPGLPAVTATDLCDNQSTVTYLGEENDGPDCPYTVTRTWETADDCGNVQTHTQVIAVGGQSLELEVHSLKFEVQSLKLEVQSLKFEVQSLEFEVQSLKFEDAEPMSGECSNNCVTKNQTSKVSVFRPG